MSETPSTPTLSSELKALIEERNMLTNRTKSKVISALDSQIKHDRESKHRELRAKAIEEIFTSEASYLNTLEIAKMFFRKPLLESKFILPEHLKSLFDNLESIYQVNGELLNQLRDHKEDVASAFIQIAPFLKLYSVYAYNYRHGLCALQELSKNNSKLDGFIKGQETRPEVRMKLGSLLIAPIQRIPRYRLLLKELLSHTSPSHPHYKTILEAIKKIESATEHINALVSDQENVERIIVLQKSLVGGQPTLVQPGRKLIKEGVLMKVSKKGKKAHPRYFLLMTDIILYCKITGAIFGEANSLRCSNTFPVNRLSIQHLSNDKQFSLTCNGTIVNIYSDEPYATETWVATIKQAILQDQQGQQTLKRRGSERNSTSKNIFLTPEPFSPRKRKQLQSGTEGSSSSFHHSPWKRKRVICGSDRTESSSADKENKVKRKGHFASIKKAISDFGQSIQRYWIPFYTGRDSSSERRLVN